MMDLPNFTILDVGHGNCAILRDIKGTVVFDAGMGDTLSAFLEQFKVKEINSVLISHADDDHIGGLLTLYLNDNIVPNNVYLNSDSKKRTKLWKELRSAAKDAKDKKGTITNTQLNTSLSGKLNCGNINIEVLAPSPELAMSGVGGIDLSGKKLTANAMSAVIRLKKGNVPIVILTGDIDACGLENMLSSTKNIKGIVLVFPHHGGNPGGADVSQFTKQLCKSVNPEYIIFSIGRGKYETPRPDLVQIVRKILPKAQILCTQLSEHCAPKLPSAGASHGNCCAGTIVVDLSKDKISIYPDEKSHKAFIKKAAPTALCIRG
ncbi:MAG: MBL fold metallo-hydrolase [Sedimentisphaerales bacterium]|jgi:competence protein ComEC